MLLELMLLSRVRIKVTWGLALYCSTFFFLQNELPINLRISDESPKKAEKARKRRCEPTCWVRARAKKKRNSGFKYESLHSGRTPRPGKAMGQPCSCPKKCFERIGDSQHNIFHDFWDIADFDKANVYLFGCIRCQPKARRLVCLRYLKIIYVKVFIKSIFASRGLCLT